MGEKLTAVMEALDRLYAVYYASNSSDVVRWRAEVEQALAELMMAYDAYLD